MNTCRSLELTLLRYWSVDTRLKRLMVSEPQLENQCSQQKRHKTSSQETVQT